MSTPLAPAAAPALTALERRLEELLRACTRLAAENRGLHQRAGRLEAELATARSAHASDTDALRRHCETAIAELRAQHAAALADGEARHGAQLDAVRGALEAELAETRASAAGTLADAEAAHAQALDAARGAAEGELATLREQYAAARTRIELMVARLRALDL